MCCNAKWLTIHAEIHVNCPQLTSFEQSSWNILYELNRCLFACGLDAAKCKYAGQNLFYFSTTGKLDIDTVTEAGILNWFSENVQTNQQDIDYFPVKETNGTIGHFTAMSRDSSISVGCAASTYSKRAATGKLWYYFLFACNYCTTNFVGSPVYETDEAPASGCDTGLNAQYSALCSLNETYST